MTQTGVVREVLGSGTALVSVRRQTACGHDCERCGGCGAQGGELTVRALTEVPVSPGDRVELEAGNRVLGLAALVYLVPVALFFLGYLLPDVPGEGVRTVCGVLGFLLGLLGALALDRRLRKSGRAVVHRIVRTL